MNDRMNDNEALEKQREERARKDAEWEIRREMTEYVIKYLAEKGLSIKMSKGVLQDAYEQIENLVRIAPIDAFPGSHNLEPSKKSASDASEIPGS